MLEPDAFTQFWPLAAAAGFGALLSSAIGHTIARRQVRRALAVTRPGAAPLSSPAGAAPPALDAADELAHDNDATPPVLAQIEARRQARRLVRVDVAAREFIAFMREKNHTGWFAAEHIDEAWLWFCSQRNLVLIDPAEARSALAEMPACRHGQRRLRSAEFAHVREAIGRDRAWVYYIPPEGVDLDRPAAGRSQSGVDPGLSGDKPGSVRSSGGHKGGTRTARHKKPASPAARAQAGRRPQTAGLFDYAPGLELEAA